MSVNKDEMIEKQRNEDPLAFEDLFMRFSPMVCNVLYRMLRNKQDAEEITQEVFFQAYKSIKDFRAEAQLSTWLYRIAVNLGLNHQRKRKYERWLCLDLYSLKDEHHSLDYPDKISLGPADTMVRQETETIVREAIDALPEKQRTAVILSRYEGLPYEEIARILEISLASVESRLHRAKKTLAKKLLEFQERKK